MTLTSQVVEKVIQFQIDTIPDNVIHAAKRALLDYCGVVINGAVKNKINTTEYLQAIKTKEKQNSVWGLKEKTDIYSAVLLNGINAHLIELDDGHRFGMMHMGAPIISVVLNISENRYIEGEKQLRAIIAGYEVAISLAKQMQPGHKIKGYHATGTCCTIGCAMAVAVLLDFTKNQIQGALSAAATSASGLLEVIDDSSQLKPYNIGRAAMDGVAAAMIGMAGYCGPNDIIGGKRGFYAVFAEKQDYDQIVNSHLFEDDNYMIQGIFFKPYAACRHCHPAIEAALGIREDVLKTSRHFQDIQSIVVKTYKLAIGGHDHTKIYNISSAKMSTPYSMITALLTGETGSSAYTDAMISNKLTAELMGKIRFVVDSELDKLNPQKRAAIVEVSFNDGIVYSRRVDYPRGEPENPITDIELEQKLLDLFNDVNHPNAQEVIKCIWHYEKDSNQLVNLLS